MHLGNLHRSRYIQMGIPLKENAVGSTGICIGGSDADFLSRIIFYSNIIIISHINGIGNLIAAFCRYIQIESIHIHNHRIIFCCRSGLIVHAADHFSLLRIR